MEANLILNVKITNKHLYDYINDLLSKTESISGLEISLYNDIKNESESSDKQPNINKEIKQNYKPSFNKQHKYYNGGWVDTEDKQAMQNMFNSFRI